MKRYEIVSLGPGNWDETEPDGAGRIHRCYRGGKLVSEHRDEYDPDRFPGMHAVEVANMLGRKLREKLS
jgi:hypothetical protein